MPERIATYPLRSISLQEALDLQFRLVDAITRHFRGEEFLEAGDYGVRPPVGKPARTERVEETLADFLGVQRVVLTQGAGTGAIRAVYAAVAQPGATVLVHDAPVYATTRTTFEMMGLHLVRADFNHPEAVREIARRERPLIVHIQHSRQRPEDRYELAEVIAAARQGWPESLIVTDENYAAFKTKPLGTDVGADLCTFSLFKLLGPVGVGLVAGRADLCERIDRQNYSGGGQVQGPQAMEALRSLVLVPLAWAVQAQVVDEVAKRLNAGEVPGVAGASIANAQDRTLIVQFEEPIAEAVLAEASALGALPYPVGSDSRFEVPPLFYRVSGTFLESNPEMGAYAIRLNPMRAGPETVLRLLAESVARARGRREPTSVS